MVYNVSPRFTVYVSGRQSPSSPASEVPAGRAAAAGLGAVAAAAVRSEDRCFDSVDCGAVDCPAARDEGGAADCTLRYSATSRSETGTGALVQSPATIATPSSQQSDDLWRVNGSEFMPLLRGSAAR